jgi:hypothetical protein
MSLKPLALILCLHVGVHHVENREEVKMTKEEVNSKGDRKEKKMRGIKKRGKVKMMRRRRRRKD